MEAGGRVLESDCSTIASWHPQYSGGWAGGYCDFVIDCDSPGYSSELSCVRVFHMLFELFPLRIIRLNLNFRVYPQCKSAYAGQMSGYCLSKLEAPPTTSPTTSDFTVDFWYPGKRSGAVVAEALKWPSCGTISNAGALLTDPPPPQ